MKPRLDPHAIDLTQLRSEFAVQDGDCDVWVGRQVRDLRKARRMSLKQLSQASGLSIGLISQIERGTSSPSLRSLRALAAALDVTPLWFFNDGKPPLADEGDIVTRRKAGRKLELPQKRLTKELLTPDLSGTLQMLLVTLEPGGSTGSESYWHPGEECGHLLDGELELWVGERHFHLKKGDSFRFNSETPHRSFNPGRTAVRILWITSPPFY